jgi:hypothetical protein
MGKRNLILYPSQWAALQQLEDQQLGRVMRQALDYAFNEVIPENKEVAFLFIKAQIDVDAAKYEEKCQQSRDAARSRWTPKDANDSDRIPTDASAYDRTKRNADDAKDKDKDKDKYNDNDKRKDNNKENTQEKSEPSSSSKFIFKKALIDNGCNTQLAEDYMSLRNRKKAPSTKTAFNGIVREANKYIETHPGATFSDVVTIMVERNWVGFDAAWVKDIPTAEPEESEYMKAMNAQVRRQREIDAEIEAERQRRMRENK